MKFLTSLHKKDLDGEICLLRVDLNVENEELSRDLHQLRIEAIIPTIRFLLSRNAKVVLLSHRGRPTSNFLDNLKKGCISFCSISSNDLSSTGK